MSAFSSRKRVRWFYLACAAAISSATTCLVVGPAQAGCTTSAIPGGELLDCTSTTPPDPTVGPVVVGAGNNVVQISSGTYDAFSIAGGDNTIIFSGGTLLGGFVTGSGDDTFTMNAGSIGGNIDQGTGVDAFTMTGGTIDSLQQGGGFDTFLMTGGTITGAFTEGDIITIRGGTIGSVNMTIGNNIFTMSGGAVLGNLVAQQHDDTVNLTGGTIGGFINLGNGDNELNVSGGLVGGGIITGTGVDVLRWSGGVISSAINLGSGDDSATLSNLTSANLATMTTLDGGGGSDRLTFSSAVVSGNSRFVNWETIDLTNATRLTLDADVIVGDAGIATGSLSIDATSTLFGGGLNVAVRSFSGLPVTVTNAGTIDLTNGPASAMDAFAVVGDYIGAGGNVRLNTVLDTDGSASDRFIIDGGSASGSTALHIANVGGAGAITTGNGILVVDTRNGGTTDAGSFALGSRVAAGPYEYALYRSSIDVTNADAWYLRSTVNCMLDPGHPACAVAPPGLGPLAPTYRPETSLYAALPTLALLYGRMMLDTLRERSGNQMHGNRAEPGNESGWGRVAFLHGSRDGHDLGALGNGPAYDYDFAAIQIGQDFYRATGPGGSRYKVGAYFAFGGGSGDVIHFDRSRAGTDNFTATTAGAYWTYFNGAGSYVDGVLQATWYEQDANAIGLRGLKADGAGFASSIEGGHRFRLGSGWAIEPQAQAVFQSIELRDGRDSAASIGFRDVQSLAGRVGLRVANTWTPAGYTEEGAVTVWLRPDLWHEFLGDTVTTFSSDTGAIPFRSDIGGTWFEIGAGITTQISGSVSLFATTKYQHGIEDDSHAFDGKLGLRLSW